MCGIAGVYLKNAVPDPQLLREAAETMKRRGPDGEGVYTCGGLGLVHRRLSVIDLAGGAQPMSTEDGRFVIVFNGEIFNYRELRGELNMTFRTASDTEVLLELYRKEGRACLKKLNGFFAFAVFDREENTLFLARDRMGVKPLYYFCKDGTFGFGSMLKTLKLFSGFPDRMNPDFLAEYLAFQYVPGNNTVYEEVYSLPPGGCMNVSLDECRIQPEIWWTPEQDIKPFAGTYEDAKEELYSLMSDAVERRMISDVPLGVFLSGGLDSAVTASFAAQKSKTPLECFSIAFEDPAYDESPLAEETAEFLQKQTGREIHFHCKQVNPCDLETLSFLASEFGEPYADSSMLPCCLLSRFARESVTAVLSGDGADELFGGYERYRAMNFCNRLPIPSAFAGMIAKLLPSGGERTKTGRLRRFLKAASLPSGERYRFLMSHGADAISARCLNFTPSRPAPYQPCGWDPDWSCAETDLHTYLPGDVLRKVDVTSMSAGLEVRSPFLDYRIAEFAISLPANWKLDGAVRKKIVGDTFASILPPGLGTRKKRGFGVPVANWFRTCWREELKSGLLSGALDPWFRRAELENLIAEHVSGKEDHTYYLFSLLMLVFFQRVK